MAKKKRSNPQDIKARVEDLLTKAGSKLTNSRVRVVINADGTVDGQLFSIIDRGESLEHKLEATQDILRDNRIPHSWTASGFRFEPSDRIPEKADYTRSRGMYQVFSSYYRNPVSATDVVGEIVYGRRGMRAKGYRRPKQMLIRIHWNATGMKPLREK